MAQKIIGWKAWFTDQSVVSRYRSDKVDFSVLSADGMLGLVLFFNDSRADGQPTRRILSGHDYYFRADGVSEYLFGQEVDVRDRNVQQEIQDRYTNPIVIRGIWTDDATMQLVEQEIMAAQWP